MDADMPKADASPELLPAIGPPRSFMPPATNGQESLVVATAHSTPPQRGTASTTIPGGAASSGDLYQQSNQYNQANVYQSLTVVNPGYSVHQVREEMSQLMKEAERRHHIATRYQNEASEMKLGTLEQQAERRHLEVVAKLERNISSIEVRAADRGKYLVAERQSLQEQNMAMQRDHAANISIAEAIQAHRLQVTYTNEMAEFARTNQEFLSEEFAQNLTIFRREEAFRLARTEDEMRAQNDELQEQLLSAECALRFFGNEARPKTFRCQAFLSEGSGYTDTGMRTPPAGPKVPKSKPRVLPEAMPGLFSQMDPGPTTAEPEGAPGLTKAPGTPRSTTGPKAREASKAEVAPDQTLAFLQTQKALLEAAGPLKGESTQEEKPPKAKEAERIKLPDFQTQKPIEVAKLQPENQSGQPRTSLMKHSNGFWRSMTKQLRMRYCDPKKFLTLDTKLLAALTKVAQGELARQILNFKEVEAGFRRAVRG